MDVTLPDGSVLQGVPDGTTKAQIVEKLKANGRPVPAEWLAPAAPPQAAQQAGSALRDIPRQVGLFARYGAEGLAGIADVGAEPIRALLNIGSPADAPRFRSSAGQLASNAADAIGLPSPRDANERVIGDATRMVASAGGMAATASAAAARAAPGVAQNVLTALAANPGSQVAGAAGAGAAGGSVREAGGGPLEQFAASLLGGVTAGTGTNAISNAAGSAGRKITQLLTPASVEMQRADQQISLILQRSGIDWTQVPERIKQGMRAEVIDAMNTGNQLDPAAVRRLLVFKRADVIPTVGQLKQDPGMITREKNLAKTGANSTSPSLQALPNLENRNVSSLLRQLDEAGAANAPSASGASRSAIDSLDGLVTRTTRANSALYDAARDSEGRSVVLDGPAAAQDAIRRLQRDGVGKLPAEVDNWLNQITSGETPLTVDYQQQLVKNLFRKMQGAGDNGDLRHGLRIVRDALDNADVPTSRQVNPSNLPAVNGAVPQSTQTSGQQAIDAYRAARTAHREWMARVEGNPALAAVVDGVQPDQFLQRYVIGKGASAVDVRALRSELDPAALADMRAALVRHLKDKATGGDQDIVKFGGKTYRDALRELDDKLPAFFNREEIQKLRDLGDAAKYMQAQPAGSAVNNSNSGALMLGRGLDMLEAAAQKLPVGRDAITGIIQGQQQRQVLAPRNALQQLAPPKAGVKLNPLLAAVAASSSANGRDDNRRD